MKMPNFASSYHAGTVNAASDVQFGAKGPRAATCSTSATFFATSGLAAGAGCWARAAAAVARPARAMRQARKT